MKKHPLRKGFTTGTAAAAAAKGATLYMMTKNLPKSIKTLLPDGSYLDIPLIFEDGMVGVIKDAGDDPDVTDKIKIFAKVRRLSKDGDIIIKGGKGVGFVTKPGLQLPVGSPAINPVPQRMIRENIREVIKKWGIEVEIIIPDGEKIAKKTFNERLGIMGGLSILGTKGIVEPMSIDAIKTTIKCEIDVATAIGYKRLAFVPGKIGEDALKKILFVKIPIIQISNFVGFSLSYAYHKGVNEIILAGHPGKLAKIAMGYLDTHSSKSPPATTYVAELFGLKGEYNTVEEIIQSLPGDQRFKMCSVLAAKIAEKCCEFFNFSQVTVYLFDMKKRLIGRCGV